MPKNLLFPDLNRRKAIALLGAASASAWLPASTKGANSCLALAAAQTEGPYWVEENLNRSDIRVDPSDGSVRLGTPLTLTLNIQEVTSGSCGPLAGAHVDVWHCDATGLYSDVAANGTVGKKFLRGYQVTGDDGAVQFTTVYPGWYSGRTVHIHVRVRTYSGSQVYDAFTAQIFFDDTVTDKVFAASAPYNSRRSRDTRNANDMVLTQTQGATVFAALTPTATGYAGTASIGVNLKTLATAAPAIQPAGVVSAASYAAGVSAGSWHALFGQNLASTTHILTPADLVNGGLPASLSGVSVSVNGKPAYLSYVSPTQINFQAPDDSATGSVPITVTTSAGTASASVAAQPFMPALFAGPLYAGNGYALAVLPDGTVLTGSNGALKPGQLALLFGTGFGPTSPGVAAGVLPKTAAPLANAVAFSIGGVSAELSFAGISAAGLYQFNFVTPTLAPGDYEVVAAIDGATTQKGLLLKIGS